MSPEETAAHARACEEIADRKDGNTRRLLIKRILDITGRKRDMRHSLDRACTYMIQQGYLTKPAWMVLSRPWISLFPTDQLMDAYEKLTQETEPF